MSAPAADTSDPGADPLPLYLLGSYWFLQKIPLTDAIREAEQVSGRRVDFLADSGGFSAYTTGATIDIDAYCEWLLRHESVITAAAGLDVIGDQRATARNTDRIRERTHGRIEIVPVFHVGSPWAELHRLCREHPYVGLGGAVGLLRRHDAMLRWLAKAHIIGREHDTRFHGFGQTRPPMTEQLPWYSVDSSYWRSSGRSGQLPLWDARARTLVSVKMGVAQSPERRRVIRDHGGDAATVSASGFARRDMDPHSHHNSRWMYKAAIEGMRRYNDFMRSRALVGAPRSGPVTGTGVKLYLAVMAAADIRTVSTTPRLTPGEVLTRAAT